MHVRVEASEMRAESALLAELFVEDMTANCANSALMTLWANIGKLMSVLGGRLGAYRGVDDKR